MFTNEFMQKFQELWNNDENITGPLKGINFTANVGYGFKDEEKPMAVIIIKDGIVTEAREYRDEELDWDMRCTPDNWIYYMKNGMGVSTLASAYSMGWLRFLKGDYFSMVKNPSMIGPFVKSFDCMSQVYAATQSN